MTDIYKYLDENNIKYERFDHPAVFTCDDAKKYCPKMPGESTKNLFLRDKDGKRHFLLTVSHEKAVDLKKLGEMFGTKFSLASSERLEKHLKVSPGSVSILGLANDEDNQAEFLIDQKIWGKTLQCHPLINTATLAITFDNLKKFLASVDHKENVIRVPEREQKD